MCAVILPLGDSPIAVNNYIIYHIALTESHRLRMMKNMVPKAMLGIKRMEELEA